MGKSWLEMAQDLSPECMNSLIYGLVLFGNLHSILRSQRCVLDGLFVCCFCFVFGCVGCSFILVRKTQFLMLAKSWILSRSSWIYNQR